MFRAKGGKVEKFLRKTAFRPFWRVFQEFQGICFPAIPAKEVSTMRKKRFLHQNSTAFDTSAAK